MLRVEHILGVSAATGGMVIASLVGLVVFPALRRARVFSICSLVDSMVVVFCYSGVMYALGGIEAMYLLAVHCIFISYVGVAGTVRVPFGVAATSFVSLGSMLFLEHAGILPSHSVTMRPPLPWKSQLSILAAATALLCVVAFVTALTRDLLKRGWDQLGERNRELDRARERALQADRLKSQFLANVSHELRTPLNHIIGFGQLIADPHTGELNPLQKEYLGDVARSAGHLLELINDLLDLSKLQADGMTLEWKEVEPARLLAECVELARTEAADKEIELSLDVREAPARISVDELRLKQVLLNLLSNALKFTGPRGRVHVCATSSRGVLSGAGAGQSAHGEAVEISVTDSGIGMEQESLKRVFVPFERSRASRNADVPGTGLGLALSRQLVELHGGRIWAESLGVGRGTTVRLVIPVRPAGEAREPWDAE